MTRAVIVGCGLVLIAPLGGCVERLIVDEAHLGGDSDDAFPEFDPDAECNEPEDCGEQQTCFEGTCVGTGEFRVSLSWEFVSDLDLHVRTPEGDEVWFERPEVGGGRLDVDDCVSGSCRDNGGVHVENVFFTGSPPRGTYEIWVVNFDGRQGGEFNIQIAGAEDVDASFGNELRAAQVTSPTFTLVY